MRTILALAPATVFLVGCLSNSPTGPGETSLAFETLLGSPYSGFDTARREAIRSTAEWNFAWQELHSGISPGPPIPAIDFGREMVVLVAAGRRNNGCYGIEVTEITRREDGRVEIEVVESVPGPSCVCTEAITTPVHVIRTQRAWGAVSFREVTRTLQC